jgi:hypothetical protein
MDGYKIFSIIVGLVYMAVLGVTESFRETGKDLFLDLLVALLFGGAWFFGKKFFKMEDDEGARVWAIVLVIALGLFVIVMFNIFSYQRRFGF